MGRGRGLLPTSTQLFVFWRGTGEGGGGEGEGGKEGRGKVKVLCTVFSGTKNFVSCFSFFHITVNPRRTFIYCVVDFFYP